MERTEVMSNESLIGAIGNDNPTMLFTCYLEAFRNGLITRIEFRRLTGIEGDSRVGLGK